MSQALPEPTEPVAEPLLNLLRRPEFERYYTDAALNAWRRTGEVDICRPLRRLKLDNQLDWGQCQDTSMTWRLYFYAGCWMHVLVRAVDSATESHERERAVLRLRAILTELCAFLTLLPEHQLQESGALDDHAVAWRNSTLCYLLARPDIVTPGSTLAICLAEVINSHVNRLLAFIGSDKWKGNNHTIFHCEALLDARLVLGAAKVNDEMLAASLKALAELYDAMVDPVECATTEQSLYYHLFNAQLLSRHAHYLDRSGLTNASRIREKMPGMARFMLAVAGEGPMLPPIGDTSIRAPYKFADFCKSLDVDPTLLRQQAPNGVATASFFPRAGYHAMVALSAAREVRLLCLTKEKRIHHGHLDGGSYLVAVDGAWLVTDCGGPYDYNNPLRFSHFLSPSAHNSIDFDKKTNTGLYRLAAADLAMPAVTAALITSTATRHWRWFHLTASGIVIILDRIANYPHGQPTLLAHVDPDALLQQRSSDSAYLQRGSASLDITVTSLRPGELRVVPKTSPEQRTMMTRATLSQEPSSLLEYRAAAREMLIAHAFSPHGPVVLRLAMADRRQATLLLRPPGQPEQRFIADLRGRGLAVRGS